MKKIKVFLITLLIVMVVGGLAVVLLGKKSTDALYVSVSEPSLNEMVSDEIEGQIVSEGENDEVIELSVATPEPTATPEPLSLYEQALVDYADQERTSVIETASEESVTITFAGDILFDPGYAIYSNYKSTGYDLTRCIGNDVLSQMRSADIMMVNNEFPYSDRGAPQPEKTYTFRAPTSTVSLLDDMGVDIVSVANNHTFDYGEDAFIDTLTTLENADMPYVGAGMNIEEAVKPYYFIANGMKIAFIGATQIERNSNPDTRGATESLPGVFRCLNPDKLCEVISEAKQESDFVILYIHWGTENTDQIDWCQAEQDNLYVEAGADIIIGDHPHCLQEIGYINGVPIVYSLGNFWFNSKTVDTCMVTLTLNSGGIDSIKFIPCLQSGCTVKDLSESEQQRIITYMNSISSTAYIDENGYVHEK